MSFTFKTNKNEIVRDVYSCTECLFISTENHMKEIDGELHCTMCRSPVEHSETITETTGMRDLEYSRLLEWLRETQSGLGEATTDKIRSKYENGETFKQVCKKAYDELEFSKLTEIDGVGESTAHKKIVLGMAEKFGWTGGKAEVLQID